MTTTETSVLLGNYAPYSGIIEYGAQPFTPPIAPLLAWAHRVLNNTGAQRGQPLSREQAAASGKSALSGYSSDEWALAKHVQMKISKEGMKPRHVMENLIPKIIDNIKRELENAVR